YERPLVELAFGASALRSVASASLPVRPGEAHLVAQALHDGVLPQGVVFSEGDLRAARDMIHDTGEGVVFVVGRPNIAESSEVVEHAIRLLASQFPQAK